MRNYKLFSLTIHFYLYFANVSSIYIENHAYKGISITISEAVKEQDFYFEKLKTVLTKSSELIYHATRTRAYFGEFIISLPSSWAGHICKKEDFTTEVSQKVDIHLTNSGQEPHLSTKHSRGCGLEGDRIDMPLDWLNENPDAESLAHQFVQQWSIYRYGVFEEKPIRKDSCYSSGTSWKPVGCYNIESPTEPTIKNGLPVCSLPDDFFENKELRSSLMFSVNSSKVLHFCDGSSSLPHNPAMPTLHNTLCKGRTVWSVIESSLDFKYGRNLPMKADKPPKTPTFKCFREERIHVTFAIQTNTVKNLKIEVMTQIASVLYEFLWNMTPKDSKATLVTFSDKEDPNNPFDLDITNSKDLYKELQYRVKTVKGISTVCLSCGLQKAFNATQDSDSSSPVVVVIAWKSAVVNDDPSGIAQSIKMYSSNTRLHLILVEDTVAKDIPTDIILAVRSLGGLIYSLPEELVFRASKLLTILADVVKKPLEVEDRIVVVHEKNFRDISQNFVDSFITPSGEFSKMVYIMYCSPKVDSVIRSDTATCTTLSPASNSDSAFKCGEIREFKEKKASLKKWEYRFSYFEIPDPLNCSSVAMLLSSQSSSSKSSVTLKGWLSEYVVKVPQNTLIIYAELIGSQDINHVMAQISGPGLESPVSLELRDNGNGDPDTKAGDGIYSRYFTEFSEKGIYFVTVSAEISIRYENSLFAENLKQGNKLVQNKTIGFFYVSDPVPELDTLPPNRVADLSVEYINHEDRTAVLNWTAPGGNYDSGKAKEYEVYYTEDWKDLQDSMLSNIQPNILKSDEMKTPALSGQPESATFKFPIQPEKGVYYVALRAVDITGNKGKISNMVQIAMGTEKSTKTNITNLNITGDGTETSTDSIQKIIAEDDFSKCYVILGGAIGVLLLIIVINIIIWLVCFQKYKKRWEELQNNSQQSAAPLKINTDVKEKIPDDSSAHPHSYTNPILEEYSRIGDSNLVRESPSFPKPATYALVEKKDRRSEERDGFPLRRVDNINIRQDYPRHRESDLGLV